MTARVTDQSSQRESFTPQAVANFHGDQPPTTQAFNAHYRSMVASNGNGDSMGAIDPPGNGFSIAGTDGKPHSPKTVSEQSSVVRAESSQTYRSPESFHPDFSTVGNDQLRTQRASAEASVKAETETATAAPTDVAPKPKPESIADAQPPRLALVSHQELAAAGDGRRTI